MPSRFCFAAVAFTVSSIAASGSFAQSGSSASMAVSLDIQDQCRIASSTSAISPGPPPGVRCRLGSPYRLSLESRPFAVQPQGGVWEIEF
jgi:hypothetical protein